MRIRVAVIILSLVGLVAAPTEAQEENSFAVGVNYTSRLASGDDARGSNGVGISWRLGHSEAGWGWTYGLGWYGANLTHTINGQRIDIGELKVRPIVGGYGYTHQMNPRWFITGDLVGGVAFTSYNSQEHVPEDSIARSFTSHIGIAPVIRPEVKTWYDINRRFGVSVGAWYAFARPKLTLDTPFGRESFRVHADTFSLSTGIVYRIF